MDLINDVIMGKPLWMWIAFIVIVLTLLIFDLGILQKTPHEITLKESLILSLFYIVLGCAFGGWIWYYLGDSAGKEYFTGFIIEKVLSIDNIFIISLIFSLLSIPRLYQYRVLFWGIFGVIVLRAIMIGIGVTLIAHFKWVLYIFAVFLIYTGITMLIVKTTPVNLENNLILKFLQRYCRITKNLHGELFLVKLPHPKTSKLVWWMTPLMVGLILVECTDIIFAIDSVPAVFAITEDPFIIYTSNIFAILGLRALYFVLAAVIHQFEYLKQALALVLIFIGSKTFFAKLMGVEKFPVGISLGVTIGLLLLGVICSMIKAFTKRS